MSIPGSNQFKRMLALVSRWVDLATQDAVVGGDRAGLLCSQERNELCGMRGKRTSTVMSSTVMSRAGTDQRVPKTFAKVPSICGATSLTGWERSERISACAVPELYSRLGTKMRTSLSFETEVIATFMKHLFFRSKRQKKRGLDFPFEKPEVIDAGPWVDKTGLSTSSRMGFAKISKLRISINRKIFYFRQK